jgi:hypothetical protein
MVQRAQQFSITFYSRSNMMEGRPAAEPGLNALNSRARAAFFRLISERFHGAPTIVDRAQKHEE